MSVILYRGQRTLFMLNLNIMIETAQSGILIRGVNWIGDAVMTLPAIKAIRTAYPGRRISLLVKPWVADIFKGNPNIDDIIIYNKDAEGIAGKFRLSRRLRHENFGTAILLQNALDAAVLAVMSRIPERIGYSRDSRGFLLTKPVAITDDILRMHHVDYYLNLLRSAGIEAERTEPHIYLGIDERLEAREKLSGLRRPVLAINPGAAFGSSKRWLAENFADVADRFIEEYNGSVTLFGGPSETAIAQDILSHMHTGKSGNAMVFAGKTSVRELIGLLSECDALLTNDSGPMHIGYAVGVPLVAIFGSTEPSSTGPVGASSIAIKHDVDCGPCFQRECPSGTLECMTSVTPDEAMNAIRNIMPAKKAVFFDRDGTLCRDAHYLNKWEDFELFPDIKELDRLKAEGYLLIGVSNQSGIGRGIVDEGFVKEVNGLFMERYGFDGFYYCPHRPNENCDCRKPEPGMLYKARSEHHIDLRASFMVGDKEADMGLGRAGGLKTVLVLTGQGTGSANADCVVRNLGEAVKAILRDGNKTKIGGV